MGEERNKDADERARRITEANQRIRREQAEHPDTSMDGSRTDEGYESQRPDEEKDRDEPVRSRD